MGSSGVEDLDTVTLPMTYRPASRKQTFKRQGDSPVDELPIDDTLEDDPPADDDPSASADDPPPILAGAPTPGDVNTLTAMNAAQWSSRQATGATYQLNAVNAITYQVVAGLKTTTDLVATSSHDTIRLVSTHYTDPAGNIVSFVVHQATTAPVAASFSSTAIVLAALSGGALLLALTGIAAGAALVHTRHRRAKALLAAHQMQVPDMEMDNIIQGIVDAQDKARPLAESGLQAPAPKPEPRPEEEPPTWRMRIKSITARAPTILIDSHTTKNRPLPLGALVSQPRPQQG